MKKSNLFLFLILTFWGVSLNASSVKDKYVSVELVPELKSVAAGDTLTVALKVNMDPGWHTYWKNPGIGMPIKIKWDLPEGVEAGDIQWPTPKTYDMSGVVNYGYGGEAWLLSQITLPKDYAAKTLPLKAKISWLMCKRSCVPGRAKLSTEIAVSKTVNNDGLVEQFKLARNQIPQATEGWKLAKKASDDKSVTLTLTPPAQYSGELKDVYFFVEQKKVIDSDAEQLLKKVDGGYELTLAKGKKPLPEVLSGILSAKSGFDSPSQAYQVSVSI